MNAAWWNALDRRGALIAALAALAAVAAGLVWGTYVAGGPDSYCYLNQAELFVQGRARDPQPIVQNAPWPNRVDTAVPVGHVAAPRGDIATVPMCPPGYPIALAFARAIGGRPAMFWVAPIFGGLAVWCTFLLGRRVAGTQAAVMAAVLFAASPVFLYQIVQPMSDVPAAAVWAAALLVAFRNPSPRQAWGAGALTGAALLIRPNLAPLALVMTAIVIFKAGDASDGAARGQGRATDGLARPAGRVWAHHAVFFFLGALPSLIVITALQNAMYGGPFTSGYGSLRFLFSIDHVLPNLARYPVWLLSTETPFVLMALAAPVVATRAAERQRAWWLLAFVLTTFACYLPYTVYDAWWFLRFLLPALPPILILAASVAVSVLSRVSPGVRVAAFVLITGALGSIQLAIAGDRAVFQLRDLERRFRDGGEYVARRLPQNAVILTTQQSGSVRFYSGRPTIIWDMLDPAWLDRALDHLRARGYRPYFLFEQQEDLTFRQRFEAGSLVGGLEWPPAAQIGRDVRIFDPEDYARFRRGEKIETDVVFTNR